MATRVVSGGGSRRRGLGRRGHPPPLSHRDASVGGRKGITRRCPASGRADAPSGGHAVAPSGGYQRAGRRRRAVAVAAFYAVVPTAVPAVPAAIRRGRGVQDNLPREDRRFLAWQGSRTAVGAATAGAAADTTPGGGQRPATVASGRRVEAAALAAATADAVSVDAAVAAVAAATTTADVAVFTATTTAVAAVAAVRRCVSDGVGRHAAHRSTSRGLVACDGQCGPGGHRGGNSRGRTRSSPG